MAENVHLKIIVTAETAALLRSGKQVKGTLKGIGVEGRKAGAQLDAGFKQAAASGKAADKSLKEVIVSALTLQAVVGTLIKALVSGFGITFVFVGMFEVINQIKRVFFELPDEISNTVAELQTMQIALNLLLSSTIQFGDATRSNFEQATEAAMEMRRELMRLDPVTIGGLQDLQTATQALLATGAPQMVNDMTEIAGLASKLVNVSIQTCQLGWNHNWQSRRPATDLFRDQSNYDWLW
jgi:hypothetical protein